MTRSPVKAAVWKRTVPASVPRLQLPTGEPTMSNITLSEARVKALRPRPTVYDIRGAKLRGFGIRVMPLGAKRFFIHSRHRRQRVWKIVGNVGAMSVDEARTQAASVLAPIRCGSDAPASADATRFESVAETVFRRCARVWKPRTHRLRGPGASAGLWTLLSSRERGSSKLTPELTASLASTAPHLEAASVAGRRCRARYHRRLAASRHERP